MTDRARLTEPLGDGKFKWCVFPCQKIGKDGKRIKRECAVSVDPRYAGPVWSFTGHPDAPTLSPSVNCQKDTCWHGFITDGVVVNPKAKP